MNMNCIVPVITEPEARRRLFENNLPKYFRWLCRPVTPKRIELIYLPFYIYDVRAVGLTGERNLKISVDGLLGIQAIYQAKNSFQRAQTKSPCCEFGISGNDAQKIASDFAKGVMLERSMRLRKQGMEVRNVRLNSSIYFPFWVGYYQRRQRYDFKTIDAISGTVQGIAMRKVFLKALREMEKR